MGDSIVTLVNDIKNKLCSAIERYQKALGACDLGNYPVSYALIQNNLGTAYLKLASVTNTKENLIKAIEAYKEALKVRTIETHPDGYATTQNNLGTALI